MKSYTDIEVEALWITAVCKPAARDAATPPEELDENGPVWDELHWESIWCGFVIALGRIDLATYDAYMGLAFIHEEQP